MSGSPDARATSTLRRHAPRQRTGLFLEVGAMVGLMAWAVVLRRDALGPSTLWLDDAWQALVVHLDSPSDIAQAGVTSPSFAFMLKAILTITGVSSIAAQILPLVLGVISPAFLYFVARRVGLSRWASLVAGGLLAVAPIHVEYSTRVKQYTLDSVLAILLAWLAWRVVTMPLVRSRWWWLASGCGAAIVLSTATAPVTAACFSAAGLSHLRARSAENARVGRALATARFALAPALAFGAFALSWYVLAIRPSVNVALRDFWRDAYIDRNGLGNVLSSIGDRMLELLDGAAVTGSVPAAVAIGLAAVIVLRRRPEIAVLLAGPTIVAIILAFLHLAPLGGGRTDTYLYPSLMLLVATALDTVIAGTRLRLPEPVEGLGAGLAGAAVMLGLVVGAQSTPAYPQEDLRPLLRILDEQRAESDGIVVYPHASFAFALYADMAFSPVPSSQYATGFEVRFKSSHITVLDDHRLAPERWEPAASGRLERGEQRIWLVASHYGSDLEVLADMLSEGGLDRRAAYERPGARLELWVRRAQPA